VRRFIQGQNRAQVTLLPETLDDYVTDTNPVRVVDVFVADPTSACWVLRVCAGANRQIRLPSSRPADDLYLRLSQPHPIQPAP
jgi:hypothetical protein